MRRILWPLLLLPLGCVHARPRAPPPPPPPPVAMAPSQSAADAAWDAAEERLGDGRFAEAEREFTHFAAAEPNDPRTSLARLQAAALALLDPDEAAGLARAAPLVQAASPATGHEAVLAAVLQLVQGRERLERDRAAASLELSTCKRTLSGLQDTPKELAAARAGTARLQQELARKEKALEDVKQRLLEIQQLAAEMLGAKPVPVRPAPLAPTAPKRQ
ncbi:MAG: hypothetical protein ACYCWW_12935 [Deltaproteobacteria bacterium]